MPPTEASILIIGAGLAGGFVAEMLGSLGISGIVVLDAGPPVLMRDARTWLDTVTNGSVPYSTLYDDPADFTATGYDPWNIVGGRIFGRGGSTLHWGGWAPRFMPEDFQQFTNTGQGADWPYGYADLEPYYCIAEQYLQVGGDYVEGQRDWRSKPYPMAAATLPITAGPIVTALDTLGISYQSMPVMRNTVSINGQSACMTNTTCQYCPIGGRFTADQAFDRLATNPNVQLVTSAVATSIVMASPSQASGVWYLDMSSGESIFCSAGQILLCNGAFEAPKLLLQSTSGSYPNGLGNNNGLVGAYLVANPYVYASGVASTNPMALQQELSFPTLCSRYWDTPEEQATGKFLMNMSDSTPFLTPGSMIYSGQSAGQIFSTVTGQVTYQLQGALSAFGYQENTVQLASGTTRFGLPRTAINTPTPIVPQAGIDAAVGNMQNVLETMGFTLGASGSYPQRGDHAAGTCRMGTSEATSVVDTNMQVWGTDNVYVVSNAVMPAIGAANISLTMVAAIIKLFADGGDVHAKFARLGSQTQAPAMAPQPSAG
jgi:choline dehydrogenase-like flavoprotein